MQTPKRKKRPSLADQLRRDLWTRNARPSGSMARPVSPVAIRNVGTYHQVPTVWIMPRKVKSVGRIVKQHGVVRARDAEAKGVPRARLQRLAARGHLLRVGRGLYEAADADVTEHHTLAQVARRVPHGVVCLLSALQFHEMTTQMPHEVWLAIDRKARKPTVRELPIRIVRFSGRGLRAGVEKRTIEGVPVRITSPARTVADCFKYRKKIGLDIALEALRAYRARRASMDALWDAARLCRVAAVMRPYLEALV